MVSKSVISEPKKPEEVRTPQGTDPKLREFDAEQERARKLLRKKLLDRTPEQVLKKRKRQQANNYPDLSKLIKKALTSKLPDSKPTNRAKVKKVPKKRETQRANPVLVNLLKEAMGSKLPDSDLTNRQKVTKVLEKSKWKQTDCTSLVLTNHIQEAFNYDLVDSKLTNRVKVNKVVVPPDMSALEVYWSPAYDEDNVDELNYLLKRNSCVTREYLRNCRIVGEIPPVLFMQQYQEVQNIEKTVSEADGLPDTEQSSVDDIVSEKLSKLEIDSESSAKLDRKEITDSKVHQENSLKSCYNDKFLDLKSRYRQDIHNESSLMKENIEEFDRESLVKKIQMVRKTLIMKEKLQRDIFQPPLILSKEASRLAIRDYSEQEKLPKIPKNKQRY